MATQKKTVQIIFPTWKTSRAYCATEPVTCAGYGCGKTIEVGELYTMHKPQAASYYYSQHPFCRKCVPFVEAKSTAQRLFREYEASEWGKADDAQWQEKYGHRSPLGPSIHLVIEEET